MLERYWGLKEEGGLLASNEREVRELCIYLWAGKGKVGGSLCRCQR
jgi:hypothetical protein